MFDPSNTPAQVDTIFFVNKYNPFDYASPFQAPGLTTDEPVTTFQLPDYAVNSMTRPADLSWSGSDLAAYQTGTQSISCSYMDMSSDTPRWSTAGCFLASLTATQANCKCYHFTDFTISKAAPVIPTPSIQDPVGSIGDLSEAEATYLIAGLLFCAVIMLFLIFTSMLAARYRRAVADEVTAAAKYEPDATVKPVEDEPEEPPPTVWEYIFREHSVLGIAVSHHKKEFGPVRRLTTLLCQITTGFFASAVWLQSGQASIGTTAIASVFSTLCSAPIYKTIKWLFMEISRISEGVTSAPAHIKATFSSRLRLVVMCLYALCYLMVLFNGFCAVLITASFEPDESMAWLYSNIASIFASAVLLEPGILVLYWLYEVKYADVAEEDDIISAADVHINKAGPQLGGLGLRFAASAMKDGLQQHAPGEIQEPEEPEPPIAPEIEAEFIRPSTPVRLETPRRPQTPLEAMPAPVPMLALEQVPEPETPELTPAPPTPPPAAVAMQEIQRMREELKARAERARLQVQAQAAQQARTATAGGPASVAAAARGGLPALAALRPLRQATDAVTATDRLSGLMVQRRDNPSRADRLQRLALSPFARNSSAVAASRGGSSVPTSPSSMLSAQPPTTAAAAPAAGGAAPGELPARGLGRGLAPLQALPRSSPRRFGGGSTPKPDAGK